MRPNQTTTHAKEADIRSHSQDYINTHLLLVPFKRHQSAAYSEQCKKREWSRLHVRDPSLCMFSGCVLTTQKGGGRLSVGVPTANLLLHAKVVCQKIVQVTSDGRAAPVNYITLWGCLCFSVTWQAVIEMSMQRGVLDFIFSPPAPLARYLLDNTSLLILLYPLYSLTPSSLSSSRCLAVSHRPVISNTVCTFDQESWIMVFRFPKVV